jgi:hypothetical protein
MLCQKRSAFVGRLFGGFAPGLFFQFLPKEEIFFLAKIFFGKKLVWGWVAKLFCIKPQLSRHLRSTHNHLPSAA